MSFLKQKVRDIVALGIVISSAVILIVYSKEISVEIVKSINRCLSIIIPSLFSFLVISNFLISSNLYMLLSKPFDLISRYIFKIKPEFFSIFLLALVTGYPCGANLLAGLIKSNSISENETSDMLCYCYTSSATFVIGLVGLKLYDNIKIGLLIYLALVFTNLIISVIINIKKPIPQKAVTKDIKITLNSQIFVDSVKNGAKSMYVVCAMIIIFSVLTVFINEFRIAEFISEFFSRFTNVDKENLKVIVSSFFEISNIEELKPRMYNLIPLITAIFSFGGVCIILQIISLVNNKFKVSKFIVSRLLSMPVAYIIAKIIFSLSDESLMTSSIEHSNKIFSNLSPIPSIFLLIMTILLLSKKSIVKY